MPFEWNSKLVVTYDELLPFFNSKNTLDSQISRDKKRGYGIQRVQLGGNGRQAYFLFDSLPQHIQNGLGDPRQANHVFEKYYKTDKEAVKFYRQYQLPDASYLDIEYQDRYTINASALNAAIALRGDILKERRKRGMNTTGIDAVLCGHAKTFNKTLQIKHKDEHTLPESEKRFKQVLNDFEKRGYVALISGKLGNDNSRKVTDETLALLESMFAKDVTKPTATDVHRAYDAFINGKTEVVNNETGEVYNPAKFKPISASTVKTYLANWNSQIATHASRSGDRQRYMQKFKPHHSLDQPKLAGSIISIDDRQPPFPQHNGTRIWFYNAIDLASECFVCWVHGATKEGIILEFYRQLVRNFADWGLCMPAELEAEMSLNSAYVNSFLREGAMFDHVRIEANNARGKRIEAYYRQLRYKLEKNREGWLARPFALTESNQIGNHKVPTLTYDEIVQGCLQDIETWNNTPHSIHKDLTRWEVFMEKQNPNLKPINWIGFLFYLGHKTISSCKLGFVRLQGGDYCLGESGELVFGEKLINLMERVEGKNVDVYWLDGNKGEVIKALIYIDTLLICEAVTKPTYNRAKVEQTAADLANREKMSKYVATIEAYGKKRQRGIEAVTIIDNTPQTAKKFIMPGLKQAKPVDENYKTEILPPAPSEDNFMNIPAKNYTKSLRDNF